MQYRWCRMRPFTARLIGPPNILGAVDMVRRGERRGGVGSKWKKGQKRTKRKDSNVGQSNGRKINPSKYSELYQQNMVGHQGKSPEGLGPDLDRRRLEFGSDGRGRGVGGREGGGGRKVGWRRCDL